VNYLSNAQKFTFQGQITVSIERPAPNRLRLEVSDTGMGLDLVAQAKLFQPFEQTTLGARQMEATGLGLSICRELARRMGGEVGVLSTPGSGSTFWAEVQVEPTQAPTPQEASGTSSTRPLKGLRVLLADDNRVNQLVGMRLLERAGAEVQTADDGAQALSAVQRSLERGHGFDAILMDVQMPVMDGLEATRQIRRLSAGHGILIVACTAAALQEDLDEALAQGMDAAITKPFDTMRLVSAILGGLQEKKRRADHVF
jgi:CheY-like chemotaxis protein